jgi:hypothetical protein
MGDAEEKAQADEQEFEKAKEEMRELEEGDPPSKLEDWPDGKAKYETYGGPDSESSYDEGPTAKLGPADLEHKEDGSIEIGGEKVDDPENYKGEPIPGGPTDDKD